MTVCRSRPHTPTCAIRWTISHALARADELGDAATPSRCRCGKMPTPTMEITELLQRAHDGDRDAFDVVVPLLYDELKKLAGAHLRREGSAAARHDSPGARGVHPPGAWTASTLREPIALYGIASRLMRQVLVDLARARQTRKRDTSAEVPLADLPNLGVRADDSLLMMNDALERLARTAPLKVQLIEMRYFGGMTAEECAEALAISVHVVRRELRLAQAWLRRELTP